MPSQPQLSSLEVDNNLTNRVYRLQNLCIQGYMPGCVVDPDCFYAVTDRGSGALPRDFTIKHGFVLFDAFYVNLEEQIVERVRLPHQIELLPGERICTKQLREKYG